MQLLVLWINQLSRPSQLLRCEAAIVKSFPQRKETVTNLARESINISGRRRFVGSSKHALWIMEPTAIFDVDDDALQNTLLRLPLPDIVRLCCVCKRWNNFVQSLGIFRFPGYTPSKPYCIRIRKDCRELEFHNNRLERCHKLSLDFISAPYEKLTLLASGGGLLLFRADDGALIVCNPLTKTWRELPPLHPPPAFTNSRLLLNAREPYQGICISPPPGSTFSFFDPVDPGSQSPIFSTIFADPLSASYCIMIAGYKRDERASGVLGSTYDSTTRIYQFSTNTWTTGGMLPRKEFYGTGGVFCNGYFYSVVRIMWRRPTIIVYDWHKRAWSDLEIELPSSILPPHLVEHNGNLLIVGACYGFRVGERFSATHTSAEVTQPSCIRIWQLYEKTMEWKEVTKMPKELYDGFVKQGTVAYECVGKGCVKQGTVSYECVGKGLVKQGTVYYECVGKGDLIYFAKENASGPELAYDLSCKEWNRVSSSSVCHGTNTHCHFRKEIHPFDPSIRTP